MFKVQKFFFFKFKKYFSYGLAMSAGRNFTGRICVQHKGGASKNRILFVDRFRQINSYGVVFRIIKDFFRTGFLGFVIYDNGLVSFILLAEGLVKGDRVFSGSLFIDSFKKGSTQKLLYIKLFDFINSLELFSLSGAKYVRAAGCFSAIVSKDNEKSVIKLNSGWHIKLSNSCLVSIGVVSNVSNIFVVVKNAGVNRKKGIRPTVRGVIKNPCDHPHGGGEGKGSPPVAQVSPWGWLCKGTPTKNKKIDRLKRKLYKKV